MRVASGGAVILGPHAQDALCERNILEDWVWATIQAPDAKEHWPQDGRDHYFRYLAAARGKCLHVIVANDVVVTVFFDRRRGRRP
jgi:hypothetical protein